MVLTIIKKYLTDELRLGGQHKVVAHLDPLGRELDRLPHEVRPLATVQTDVTRAVLFYSIFQA